ncbi:unnamed protein product [Brachionus calyciflorus]|uniref:FLYWCH-type domain-containing protein n=1 Tax=Brachionus calyciflorus TaxID=104777 RepID=A0A814JY92_9BILA|nr:unnamed protein product [Brachionus calyciflorus]
MNTNENSLIYLPNYWFTSEKVNQENQNHDCMDLCLNGYLYKRQRINKNSINWLCKTSGCNASVTITKDEKISRCVEHKKEIKHELVDEQEMLRIKFNNDWSIFECQMWNHFANDGYPRTNNNLEGYNNKLSNHLSIAHPDIFKAISKFKEEETDASLKYYRAMNNEKPPERRKLNVINDAILNNGRQMLQNNEISIDTYSKYVAMMFDINALSTKKKKVHDDNDDHDDNNQSDDLSSASDIDSDDSELEEFN